MMSTKLVSGLILLCLGYAAAWGPITHYYLANLAFTNSSIYIDQPSLQQGCDMPDSIYFANYFTLDEPTCTLSPDNFHNLVTGGYFLEFATTAEAQRYGTPHFLPLSFAIGYGSHMVADLVGFFANKGLLGHQKSWMNEFGHMTVLDALTLTKPDPFILNTPWASADAGAFLSAATNWTNNATSNQSTPFPYFTEAEINTCILPWASTAGQLAKTAILQASTFYYQPAIIMYDPFGAPNLAEAENNFDAAAMCAADAIEEWVYLILNKRTSPTIAAKAVTLYVQQMFDAGKCTVSR